MARNYAVLLHEYEEEFAPLSDAEVGRLVRALITYSKTGREIQLEGNERFLQGRVFAQERLFQAHYEEIANKRRRAGKQGARSRWGDYMANDSKHGNTNTETQTETHLKTNTDGVTHHTVSECAAMSDAFQHFWEAYPSRYGDIQLTRAIWQEIVPNEAEMLPEILAGIDAYKASKTWKLDGGRYIPQAAKFLRNRMWEICPSDETAYTPSLGAAEVEAIHLVLQKDLEDAEKID